MKPMRARLLARMDQSAGFFECWPWTGRIADNGYGKLRTYGKSRSEVIERGAHRLVYQEFVGPIPEGLQLDHLCRNRECVNPAHLEVVTQRDNILRGSSPSAINARKTQCKRGHSLDPDRACRICQRIRYRARTQTFRPSGEPGAVLPLRTQTGSASVSRPVSLSAGRSRTAGGG